MHKRAPIPLIRQIEVSAVLELLRDTGAPIQKLLASAKLPAGLEDCADGFVSARSMLAFTGLAAQSQGIPDLGWQAVDRASLEKLGGWGERVAQSQTLRRAIQRFCCLYAREVFFVELGLRPDHGHAWLWRRRTVSATGWTGEVQGEQYMLGAMIQVVRRAAGSSWTLPAIRLESPASSWVQSTRGLCDARVEYGGPVMAIAVPYSLLDLPLRRLSSAADRDAGTPLSEPLPATDLAGSLRQALAPLLAEQPLSIELGAELSQTSPRTLCRWLAAEGTSWGELVAQVRFESCAQMLVNPQIPIVAISAQLGYSDQAHFSRAFRRWTGESPNAYRRRRLN